MELRIVNLDKWLLCEGNNILGEVKNIGFEIHDEERLVFDLIRLQTDNNGIQKINTEHYNCAYRILPEGLANAIIHAIETA